MRTILSCTVGLGLLAATTLYSPTITAQSQAPCDRNADTIVAEQEKQGRHVAGLALDEQGNLLRVLVSDDDASWAVVVSMPSGPGCLIDTGTGWQWLDGPS